MNKNRIVTIADVVSTQLCLGCGVCAYISPDEIEMHDVPDFGRRPLFKVTKPRGPRSEEALRACPGIELTQTIDSKRQDLIQELLPGWGPVLEIWEGYAADKELRYIASSAGVSSALALYCLEKRNMYGVLQTKAREDVPYLNKTVLSKSRAEIIAACGSRYAPASPGDGLQAIEDAGGECVFIGKPCDAEGLSKACFLRESLKRKLGLTISIFCAGTPSTQGTLEMFRKMGIEDISSVTAVRYRGMGWPGKASVLTKSNGVEKRYELSYPESWGKTLSNYIQWRCFLCPDHSGEFSDIAVGDSWHRYCGKEEPGWSIVLVRTEKGREIIRQAQGAGYINLERARPDILPKSQINLLRARGVAWARVWMCRLMGVAAPRYKGMPIFSVWRSELNFREKVWSLVNTVKQALKRKLYRAVMGRRSHKP